MAAEQGERNAQYELGNCYANGDGVAEDQAVAAQWFRKAAEQGDYLAQFSLSRCYKNGDGVAKDLAKAAQWHRKAVELRDARLKGLKGLKAFQTSYIPNKL